MYHIVRTIKKSDKKTKGTTLSEQFKNLIEKQNVPHCQSNSEI